MGDQQLVGIDRIVAALNRINASIQKTKTYRDGNMIRFTSGADEIAGIAEVAAIGALLGILGITTLVPGTIAATSGTDAALHITEEAGNVAAQSGSDGSLIIDKPLVGVVDSQAGITAELEQLMKLIGTIAGQASVDAALTKAVQLAGNFAATGGADAELARWREGILAGVIAAESGVIGEVDEIMKLAGTCDIVSATSAPKLWL